MWPPNSLKICLIQRQSAFGSSWKAISVAKCLQSTKLRQIISNFGQICIQISATQRALVVTAAKGSHKQNLGRGPIERDIGTSLLMIRVIFRVPIWFIWYPITVNKEIMGRHCDENKEKFDGVVCQICPHTPRNVSCR